MYGALFGAIAIAVRLLTHYNGHALEMRSAIMMHLLLILLAIFFSSKQHASHSDYDFIALFKAGMRGGLIYALIVAVFTYVYFGHIAPEVFEARNTALLNTSESTIDEAGKEEMLNMFTASRYAQFTFFAYFMMTVIYSLLVAVFHRKVLMKLK